MDKHLIMVTSFTSAMRGKEILKNKGIEAEVLRTFNKAVGGGCGYSLRIGSEYKEAEKILREEGIKILTYSNLEVEKNDIS